MREQFNPDTKLSPEHESFFRSELKNLNKTIAKILKGLDEIEKVEDTHKNDGMQKKKNLSP